MTSDFLNNMSKYKLLTQKQKDEIMKDHMKVFPMVKKLTEARENYSGYGLIKDFQKIDQIQTQTKQILKAL